MFSTSRFPLKKDNSINFVLFSHDCTTVAALADDITLCAVDASGETGQITTGMKESEFLAEFGQSLNKVVADCFDASAKSTGIDELAQHIISHKSSLAPAALTRGKFDEKCVFSPDEKEVARAHNENNLHRGKIIVWNVRSGEQRLEISPGCRDFKCMAWSADGKYLAGASTSDFLVRVWDVQTGAQAIEPLRGNRHWVLCVCFNSDSSFVVSGGNDKRIYVWELNSEAPRNRVLIGHTGAVNNVAGSPVIKNLVLSASCDKSVRLWDMLTGDMIRVIRDHGFWVTKVAWSLDGTCFASAGMDQLLCVYKHTGKVS
jgi:WD40 repeat protein